MLYVLKCKHEKYYIGKTLRPISKRIKEHFSNCGSEWTKQYEPVEVIETVPLEHDFHEDVLTKKYMQVYGIKNVRGGTYSMVHLPEYKILSLQDEICTARNTCFRCGRAGHYAKQCFVGKRIEQLSTNQVRDLFKAMCLAKKNSTTV